MHNNQIAKPVTLESMAVTLESVVRSIDGLTVRVDKIPTRDEMNKIMDGKIDDLAVMVAKGFKESDINLMSLKKQMEVGFREANTNIESFRKEVNERFDLFEDRTELLEKTLFNDHARRIRKIETKLQIA